MASLCNSPQVPSQSATGKNRVASVVLVRIHGTQSYSNSLQLHRSAMRSEASSADDRLGASPRPFAPRARIPMGIGFGTAGIHILY